MRVLVTGHDGYIGCALVPMLLDAGHDVVGLDTFLFEGCVFGKDKATVPAIRADVRDVTPSQLEGFDAVIHLAAISNDPIGELNSDTTYAINHRASVSLAEVAKAAGVSRFLFSSSCSLYGKAGDAELDETADFNPVTAYGKSKVLAEQDLSPLADDSFSPVYLRNATAYGLSSRLRADLVVNNLAGFAVTTGEVVIKSDGTPWRPLVHIEDISLAFLVMLDAPRELVHDKAYNVGPIGENYQIRDLAAMVERAVPGSTVKLTNETGPDERSYQVDFGLIHKTFPDFRPAWNVERGIQQLVDAYRAAGIAYDDFDSVKYQRIKTVRSLMESGKLNDELRWVS